MARTSKVCAGSSANRAMRSMLPVAAALDRFDRMQLESVVRICRESASLSDAGRRLFDVSRLEKAKVNDADRLRKYLARFGLDWQQVRGQAAN
ncbi:sigma 54-dependent transcriptional regulator, partial [Ralstonia pseudosolanacearum]